MQDTFLNLDTLKKNLLEKNQEYISVIKNTPECFKSHIESDEVYFIEQDMLSEASSIILNNAAFYLAFFTEVDMKSCVSIISKRILSNFIRDNKQKEISLDEVLKQLTFNGYVCCKEMPSIVDFVFSPIIFDIIYFEKESSTPTGLSNVNVRYLNLKKNNPIVLSNVRHLDLKKFIETYGDDKVFFKLHKDVKEDKKEKTSKKYDHKQDFSKHRHDKLIEDGYRQFCNFLDADKKTLYNVRIRGESAELTHPAIGLHTIKSLINLNKWHVDDVYLKNFYSKDTSKDITIEAKMIAYIKEAKGEGRCFADIRNFFINNNGKYTRIKDAGRDILDKLIKANIVCKWVTSYPYKYVFNIGKGEF